jgi:hypothetical protein
MQKALKMDWFVQDSIGETLKNVLETADLPSLKKVSPAEFAKMLLSEIHFLSPYNKQEEREVERYIYQHLTELYQFVQTLAQQEQSV